jgi:hypothetical protein
MFTRDFRIWGSILISWTVLFFVFPVVAAIILGFGFVCLFSHAVVKGVRDGVTAGGIKWWSFPVERVRRPFLFWFYICLFALCGIISFVGSVWGIASNAKDHKLWMHYIW